MPEKRSKKLYSLFQKKGTFFFTCKDFFDK